ncbi:hypothetical protein T09_5551, partial [Trichinella sp. T9]
LLMLRLRTKNTATLTCCRLCSILLSGKIAALPLKQSNCQFHCVEEFFLI